MLRIKFLLLTISILLITLDRFAFIGHWRDYMVVYLQKQTHTIGYRLQYYPRLLLLSYTKQHKLEQENVALRLQVESYDLKLKQAINQNIATKALSVLQKEPKLYSRFNPIAARVIIDVNYLVNSKLLIDKGSNSGIRQGMAVVNKDGVVGQVSIVNADNAQITTIANPEYKIYLQTPDSMSRVLAQGIGNNNIMVKYISKSDPLKIGDELVTTGLDDIYPANIPVARIKTIFSENNGFNAALCEPVINLNKLQFVLALNHRLN